MLSVVPPISLDNVQVYRLHAGGQIYIYIYIYIYNINNINCRLNFWTRKSDFVEYISNLSSVQAFRRGEVKTTTTPV